MIYVHSLGRAFRYYPEQKALALGGNCLNFRDLEHRVARVAAALSRKVLASVIASPSCSRTARVHRVGVRLQQAGNHCSSVEHTPFRCGNRARVG